MVHGTRINVSVDIMKKVRDKVSQRCLTESKATQIDVKGPLRDRLIEHFNLQRDLNELETINQSISRLEARRAEIKTVISKNFGTTGYDKNNYIPDTIYKRNESPAWDYVIENQLLPGEYRVETAQTLKTHAESLYQKYAYELHMVQTEDQLIDIMNKFREDIVYTVDVHMEAIEDKYQDSIKTDIFQIF